VNKDAKTLCFGHFRAGRNLFNKKKDAFGETSAQGKQKKGFTPKWTNRTIWERKSSTLAKVGINKL
jgi:hypothetical protein